MTQSVLMFCTQFSPYVGGAERQAKKLSEALVLQGVRVTVLTPKLAQESPIFEEKGGVLIHRFPIFDLCGRYPWMRGMGIVNVLSLALQTRHAASKLVESHDIVHSHGVSALTVVALLAARKLRKPFVCKLTSSGDGFDLKKLSSICVGGKWLVKYMLNNVDVWIATTNAVTQSLVDYGVDRERIAHIPNGVGLPITMRQKGNGSPIRRFLYVGRLSKACGRDFDTLIDAFLHLALTYPNVELALVGDGDQYDRLKKKLSTKLHESQFHMPGLVGNPTEWFEWADCFVLPSRREGMSNALLEAMAFGLICIANDVPANREVLDDGNVGYLTLVGNIANLHEQMEKLVVMDARDSITSRLVTNRVRREYAIDAVATKCLALYGQLCSGK